MLIKKEKESDIQKQIVEYLSRIAHIHGMIFFSIPNESLMTALIMFGVPEKSRYKLVNHFKKMGLVSGIPDICILSPKIIGSIFLEVKKRTGVTSDKQKIIHNAIEKTGNKVFVVRCLEDVIEIIKRVFN